MPVGRERSEIDFLRNPAGSNRQECSVSHQLCLARFRPVVVTTWFIWWHGTADHGEAHHGATRHSNARWLRFDAPQNASSDYANKAGCLIAEPLRFTLTIISLAVLLR